MARSPRSSWIVAAIAACSAPATQRPSTPGPAQPGQPVAVAVDAGVEAADGVPSLRLPKTFVATGYTATLTIDPAQPRFTGRVVLDGTITDATSVVWLHARGLEFSSVTAPGTPTLTRHGDDLIALRVETPLQPGPWSVTFEYTGAIDPLSTAGMFVQKVGKTPYVYTQLEALYARRVFPCIDEPDSKVPWQLTIEVPKGNIAVSNTPLVRESAAGKLRRFEFARTKPLPSYLVALGVGPFDIVDGGKTKSGVPVRILAMKGRAPDAAFAAKATARVLDLAETWFGIPYPYEKLDMLAIPLTVGFGAMENAGLITHAERIILFDPKTLSAKQQRSYVGVLAHEIAHQWFGDLVTMAWWDDLWLNEGFATWLGNKLAADYEPAWHLEQEAFDTRHAALAADAVISARRVRQPIATVGDIESAFDRITYRKGASVLAMFESYVGPDVFQRGVRDYIKTRAWGNATSADFVAAISAAAGTDLAPAFGSFLDQVGAPALDTKLVCDKSGARLELAQQRHVTPGSPQPPSQRWQVPVCAAYLAGDKRTTSCTLLTEATGVLPLATKTCPRWVMPNVDGRGYYRVRYTQEQVRALRDEAWPRLRAGEQRALVRDVQDSVTGRERRLPLTLALSFVPKLLARADRFAVDDAVELVVALERLVPAALADKFSYYVRTTFGPGATKLGLAPGAKDSLDDERLREALAGTVAWHGRDPDLIAKVSELAASWRDLPAALRALVLRIAVDADANLAAKIMREVAREPDRARRRDMYGALGAQRDPKRYEAALELVFDAAVDAREAVEMLDASSTEATRAVAERFVRGHETKLLARLPTDAVTGLSGDFARILAGSCDKARRDDARAYAFAHYAPLAGGPRLVEQAFEGMDQCIAAREVLAPQIQAWLAGVRLPKKR